VRVASSSPVALAARGATGAGAGEADALRAVDDVAPLAVASARAHVLPNIVPPRVDRKGVVEGERGGSMVDLGGRRRN
jgi:hypothetical protein